MDMFEMLRRLGGGNFYHTYSGVTRALGDSGVGTTGGGDNNVLVQQTAQFLLKKFNMPSNIEPDSSVAFFLQKEMLSSSGLSFSTWEQAQTMHREIVDAFSLVLFRELEFVSARVSDKSSYNENLRSAIMCSELFYWRLLLDSALRDIEETATPKIKGVLNKMLTLVCLWQIERLFQYFAMAKVFDPSDFRMVQREARRLSLVLRNEAAALVDCFGIPDKLLRVPLANGDGSCYEAYLDAVRQNRLNQYPGGVWPHWKETVGKKVANNRRAN